MCETPVVPCTPRELVRRWAVLFGWTLEPGDALDTFHRDKGETLIASYHGQYPSGDLFGLYNRFIEEGEAVERRRNHTEPRKLTMNLQAWGWLHERHNPAPKVPFVADGEGVVTHA